MMALRTFGQMQVDWEERVNIDRLRKERLAKAKAQLKQSEAGALLCFDMKQHSLHHRDPHWHMGPRQAGAFLSVISLVRLNKIIRVNNQGAEMKVTTVGRSAVFFLLVLLFSNHAFAQHSDAIGEWATNVGFGDQLHPNIVYRTVNATDLKLDVITTGSRSGPKPVVIFFHGGGWVQGSKDNHLLKLMPYLAHGMDGVNVEYRLADQARAPGAVEDCRCALRWVVQHAKNYGFDPTKIVITGESAGGHLALMTGMLKAADGFDYSCDGIPNRWGTQGESNDVKIAAIVNFFGITDVADSLQSANLANVTTRWLGSPNTDLAKKLSPLTYVRQDLPPIISIHGDKDTIVPYEQAVRLHQALEQAGVVNQLVTVHGGHGPYVDFPWTAEQNRDAYQAVFQFLEKADVLKQ
jgi:acetyl esterase/lipase